MLKVKFQIEILVSAQLTKKRQHRWQ